MNNKSWCSISSFWSVLRSGTALTLAVLVLAIPVASNAQETTSAIRGVVTDDAGNPLAGATVTVRNEDSGLTRVAVTNESGVYNVRNLPIDDNYTVSAGSTGFGGMRSEGLSVDLGRTTDVNFSLGMEIEEIVTVGVREGITQTAVGPSTSFGLADLQDSPAINRNINDVIRVDPRIYIDESRGGINAIQCAGANPRYNSLTVDGVRLNDSFGLNSNGYPTERMPFSYDAIQQVAVELAPFDVEYGLFSACNINAVTKSGGNSFSGSAFYDYTDNDLRADKLEGDSISTGDYDEKRYGVTFGGPIIQDKLFFFAAYEKLEGANLFDRGPIGSGAVNEINIAQAELDEILEIARDPNLYNYDPGGIPSSRPHEDEKLLIKLDLSISDTQRLAFTYNYNDGYNWSQSDSDNNEFEFENHLYERGAELNSYVGSLFSDWSDVFSTELRVSYLELDNRQISVNGSDFGEIRVETPNVDVYLGGDDSRQDNKLAYDVTSIAFKGNYYLGDHNLTFGLEQESLEVFNKFVQHTSGEFRFDGIENFRNGLVDAIYYNNSPTLNPDDAAADWGYDVNTVYIQDEFTTSDDINLIFGLRYDWYTTSDEPPVNPDFLSDYGFGNNATVDGLGLLQPRFGFTWDLSGDTTVRGGIGLYSGGNPNVWLSNNYSANNVQQFGQRGRSFCYTPDWNDDPDDSWYDFCTTNYTQQRSLFDPDVVYVPNASGVPDGPGWGVPSELVEAVQDGVGDNFEINYLDPDFELPSEWKFALGITHNFPGDYLVNADLLITRGQDSVMVKHGDIDQTGTNPDGYPIYSSPREASFVLTNSNKGNRSTVFSIGVQKAIGDNFDYRIGYAHTDAEDIQPMTSSVAFSNYTNRAFFDPNEDVRSTSNYQIEHRITADAKWRKEFGNNLLWTVALYAQASSGEPYSIAYDGTINPYGFTPYLDFLPIVLEPGEKRNGYESSWWRKVDLYTSLDFPGFADGHEGKVFLVVDNFTNLLNDSWGVLYQHNFPGTVEAGTPQSRIGDASRYEIRFGVKYSFE